jgi:hypothetical protein
MSASIVHSAQGNDRSPIESIYIITVHVRLWVLYYQLHNHSPGLPHEAQSRVGRRDASGARTRRWLLPTAYCSQSLVRLRSTITLLYYCNCSWKVEKTARLGTGSKQDATLTKRDANSLKNTTARHGLSSHSLVFESLVADRARRRSTSRE